MTIQNEWSDVEHALRSTDQVLAAIGNLAGWDRNRPVYVTTLLRSVGSVASQIALLVTLGYVRLGRAGQNTTVYVTQDGIESVLGYREPLFEVIK